MSMESKSVSYSSTTERGDRATSISTPDPERFGPRTRNATWAVSTSNGTVFLSFQRMKVSWSSLVFERRSEVRNAIRAVSSGTTTTISDPLKPACFNASRTFERADPISVPGGRSMAHLSVICIRRGFTPATMRWCEVSSHAHRGSCGLNTSVTLSRSPLSNECHLVNFLQGRDARKYFRERRLTEKRHAFFVRDSLDFGCRSFFNDHFANPVREIEQLVNCSPAAISGAVALQTTLPFIEGEVAILFDLQTGLDQDLFRLTDGLPAVRTDHPHQALREDAVQRRYEVVRIDAHVQKASEHVDDVVCMYRCENEV